MYFVFVNEVKPNNSGPSFVCCGWLNSTNFGALSSVFDNATSFPSFEDADNAARAAGCHRYVILCLPTVNYCECREIDSSERF